MFYQVPISIMSFPYLLVLLIIHLNVMQNIFVVMQTVMVY